MNPEENERNNDRMRGMRIMMGNSEQWWFYGGDWHGSLVDCNNSKHEAVVAGDTGRWYDSHPPTSMLKVDFTPLSMLDPVSGNFLSQIKGQEAISAQLAKEVKDAKVT